MNKIQILSLICFFLGIVFFALGFFTGDVEGGIIVIFPFIAGTGIYAFLGFIFFFIASLIYLFRFKTHIGESDKFQDDYNDKPSKKTSVKGGGVVLIGPIPIVFGSNWKIALLLMILAIMIIVLVSFFMLRFY